MGIAVLVGAAPASASATADGRNYEMVSPVDKNGGDVAADNVSITTSSAGDAVAYLSRGSFGDTIGSGAFGQTEYVARRAAAGWTNASVTPTPRFDAAQAFISATAILGFSADLRRAVVWGYDLPGASGAIPQTTNIYAEDTTNRALQLVTQPTVPVNHFAFTLNFAFPDPGSVSYDSRHIAFRSSVPLLPDAPAGVTSVYQWDDGALRVASVLPDGTPAAAGADLPLREYRENVSPDGSRVLFVSPPGDPSGQLYMRVDHDRTAWVSEPEASGPPPTPQDIVLQQVTGDSRHVIFATSSRLLDNDPNDGSDLYLYTDSADPASDPNLTLISNTGDVPGNDDFAGTSVIGSSDNARRIYYYANQRIRLWENGATTVVADDVVPNIDSTGMRLAATATAPGAARVSPNGRYLAFISTATPTRNGVPVAANDGHAAMYLYDAATDRLQCVSCPSSGPATTDASVIPTITHMFPSLKTLGLRPPFLADDGRTFFSTAEALVPQDVNGLTDAYEFDPASGAVVLLSTGKGSEPASFAAVSASGNDAFIVTRQQLVKADRDALVDVYDARVGGGFPDQIPTPSCDGDACQGALPVAPEDSVPGSLHIQTGSTPHERIRVLRRIAAGEARAQLRIALPAAGSLSWSGHGIRHGSRRFLAAGSYTIDVSLTRRARNALTRHALRVRLRLTFTPPGGAPSSVTTTVAFKRPASKKGR